MRSPSTRHRTPGRLVLLSALAVAAASRPAHAQVTTRFSLSAGPTTATSQSLEGNSHGWGGTAAVWLSVRHVPVGVRADIDLYRSTEHRGGGACPTVFIGAECEIVGFRDAADIGTLDLTLAPFRGRISPYLLGGIGAYRLTSIETHYPPPCINCNTTGPRSFSLTTYHFGTSAGGGVAVRVGRVAVLAEARYHAYKQLVGRGHMVPITLGVRF